jgi:hypothetical protein
VEKRGGKSGKFEEEFREVETSISEEFANDLQLGIQFKICSLIELLIHLRIKPVINNPYPFRQ